MEIPKLLTSIELVKISKLEQLMNNYNESPDTTGFVTFEEKMELLLDENEIVKQDDTFTWQYTVASAAFEGEQTEDTENATKVVEGGITFNFQYTVLDGEFSMEEIRDSRWLFYLSLKPVANIRMAELLKNTPIQNLQPPLMVGIADFA